MTDFEEKVIYSLAELKQAVKDVNEKLDNDYRALHGNGHPGLLDRMTVLEHNWRWVKWLAGLAGAGAGILLSACLKHFL